MMSIFTWLPDAAWRGALLLLIAFFLARLLRSQPAAVRHLLWASALAGVMVMPLLPALAPFRMPVPVAAPLSDLVPAARNNVATIQAPDADSDPYRSATEPATSSMSGGESSAAQSDPLPVTTEQGWLSRVTLPGLAVVVWTTGLALLSLHLLAGFIALARLRRRAHEPEDETAYELLSACAARIGVHVVPRLLVSPGVAMPCTAGWRRPVILLPDEYGTWPRERLEVVLLHELGHIRRMDILPHLLGEFARVVYWFNPLVWLAAARLRAEAERATDDRVVHAGARPSDYAAHLLDIVQRARAVWHPAPLMPLARRSEFEGRMLAILESSGRVLPGAGWALGIAGLIAGLSLGVASLGGATLPPVIDAGQPASVIDSVPDEDPLARSSSSEAQPVRSLRQNSERQSTVTALAEALRDPVAQVREAAAQALGNSRDTIAVRALIEVLRTDESALVRRSAAWSLGEMGDPAAIPVLSEALTRDRDAQVRRNAASALGSIDNQRATPALAQALERDTDVSVRMQAAEALANIEDPAAIDALIRVLDRDDDAGVRRAAVEALDNLEDSRAVPAVSRALRDADVEVRRAAADALGSMDDREAVPALIAVARDANAEVRHAAINSLGNLDDRRALPAFVAALSDTDVDVRRAAAQAFGNIENVRAAPAELIRAMNDADGEVRHSVAHALGSIGDPDAVPALIARIDDANVEVRRAVVDALGDFDDPAIAAALRTALKDSDAEVRESAARALGNRSKR